jgi:hypothetical protein
MTVRMSVGAFGRGEQCADTFVARRVRNKDDGGFTLLELLIVCVVSPVIIGALAIGLMTMLGLQSGVSNRLSDSEDSQVVQASYRNDVQSAQEITTVANAPGTPSPQGPECNVNVNATQVLGLEWNLDPGTGVYGTVVTYLTVPTTVGTVTTYSLIRNECTGVTTGSASLTPSSSNTLSSSLSSALTPNVVETSGSPSTGSGWVAADDISSVSFPISEQGTNSGATGGYQFTLVASLPSSNQLVLQNAPVTNAAEAGCGYADITSGTYASSLCFIDFTALNANNGVLMTAARSTCQELEVPLPGGSVLYFCIAFSGAPVFPASLPTWNNDPFYPDVSGLPALYKLCEGSDTNCTQNGQSYSNNGGNTTVTLTGITVVAPDGNPATGWELVSADAESTDGGEWITWSSGTPMYSIPNNIPSEDNGVSPIGNACNSGAGVVATTNSGATTVPSSTFLAGTASATSVTCNGFSNGTKTGTLMVEAQQPTSMTITMLGTGLEGISLGLLF